MAEEGAGAARGAATADDRTILDDLTVLAPSPGAQLEAGPAQTPQQTNRPGGLDELTTIHQGSSVQPQLPPAGLGATTQLVPTVAEGVQAPPSASLATGPEGAAPAAGQTGAGSTVGATASGYATALPPAGSSAHAGQGQGIQAVTSQPPATSAVATDGATAAASHGPPQGPAPPAGHPMEPLVAHHESPTALNANLLATPPDLWLSAAGGLENGRIALDLAAHPSQAGDTVVITIGGLPAGAVLRSAETVLTPDADGLYRLTPEQLQNLNLLPAADDAHDFTLTVIGTETNGLGSSASTSPTLLPVTVAGVAQAPVLTQTAAPSGNEGSRIALDLSATVRQGDERLSLTIAGVPDEARFYDSASAGSPIGTRNADGSWSFSADELALAGQSGHGLYLQPAANWNDYDSAGHNAGLPLTAILTATETDPDSHLVSQASTSLDFTVHVAGVADAPTLSVGPTVTTLENTAVALSIDTAAVTDTEAVSMVAIRGVPAGASFTDGSGHAVGIEAGGGLWTFTTDQLSGLHILPPTDNARDFTLTVTATSQELGSGAAQATAVSAAASIAVKVVGSAPVPGLGLPTTLTGDENSLVDLHLALHAHADETLVMSIAGVVAGSHFYADSDGTLAIGTLNPTTGLWTFTTQDIATATASGHGFYLQPPAHWTDWNSSGHTAGMALTFTLAARETDPDTGIVSTSRTSAGASLHILPVADSGATLTASAHLAVADGSEYSSAITFSDLQGLAATADQSVSSVAGGQANPLALPDPSAHSQQIADAQAALALPAAGSAHDAIAVQSSFAEYVDGSSSFLGAQPHAAADFHFPVDAFPVTDAGAGQFGHGMMSMPVDDKLAG